ncbi:MAG: hypothetical protein ISS15_15340 [Alphaproteobacteria bacterium]|nr:hypothetical protein [Alphaproteobacteria bacterium]MBL6937694.1 hypothetical protein [Alphaproteobacteria bacterium]MBL7099032.1 hypothetical protein [Alphaproteobacteria bacterium]
MASTTMTAAKKPTYLGLLNAISLAETEAGVYLRAWADATCDEELACTLRLVAARETSHGVLFCRMLSELGYELREKADPKSAERIARYANPKISDLDKLPKQGSGEEKDPFGEIERAMADGAYDPVTCNMLSWYICEERDSGAKLREAYAKVRAKAGVSVKSNGNGKAMTGGNGHSGPSEDAKAIMACMTEGFARLEKSIQKAMARA